MHSLFSRLTALALVAVLGHFTAGRVEAQGGQPTHQALEAQLTTLRTTIDALRATIDNIHTLVQSPPDQGPPSWSQKLAAADRFVLVLDGAAVLDRETGLVWEQAPRVETSVWEDAQFHCNSKAVGGRKGWRMPTVQELTSLVDPNNPEGNPDLPSGHPFVNVQLLSYWSATSLLDNPTVTAWNANFSNGGVGYGPKVGMLHHVWCVRGGNGGVDLQ